MAEAHSAILVVDDDAEDLGSIERALGPLGCEVLTVKDPHEVIPTVDHRRPEVVILDALLPGLSGFDLCKQIKSDPELRGTRVLILTGVYLRQQYRQEALQQFKADAFLTKPFRPPELQRLIQQLLAKKGRTPPSSFLRRIGFAPQAPNEPRKGILRRFFVRGEQEPEPPEAESEAETPEPIAPVEAASAPEPAAEEAATPPEEVARPGTAPLEVAAAVEETPPPEEPGRAEPASAPEPGEDGAIEWVQVETRTQELTLEEAASRVLAGAPEDGEASPQEEATDSSGSAEVETEATIPVLRRPRLRVGEVPIYEDEEFVSELKRELSKCKRVDRPLTLILIQVSDLQQIVEIFGRGYREQVLWHVAQQAMASLREVDLVGMISSRDLVAMTAFASDRYGGSRIVSRMRRSMSRSPFRVGTELPPIVPALQFGIATFPEDGREAATLIGRAERELSAEEPSPTES